MWRYIFLIFQKNAVNRATTFLISDKGSGKQSGVCWFDAGCVGVSLSGISVWCSGAGVVEC